MVDVQKRTHSNGRPARSNLKILVVDDESDMRAYVIQCLGYLGDRVDEVMEAEDGMEALALARRVRLDLVITDIMMPRLNGYELSERLKALPTAAPIKILVISGYTAVDSNQWPSIDAVLDKPFNAVRLQECLDALLEEAAGDEF